MGGIGPRWSWATSTFSSTDSHDLARFRLPRLSGRVTPYSTRLRTLPRSNRALLSILLRASHMITVTHRRSSLDGSSKLRTLATFGFRPLLRNGRVFGKFASESALDGLVRGLQSPPQSTTASIVPGAFPSKRLFTKMNAARFLSRAQAIRSRIAWRPSGFGSLICS